MKYFGTDGIRGIAFEKLNSELAYKLGQGIARVLRPKHVVVGLDTRESSNLLGYSVSLGLMNAGVNVIFIDVVSTPVVAYYSKKKNIPGVMITASHNPFTDNGIKVFDRGYKSGEGVETQIEEYIDNGKLFYKKKKGQFTLANKPINDYLTLYNKFNLKGLKIKLGYDSANGANHLLAKTIFDKHVPSSIQINNFPNGKNINFECGSTHMETIIKFVIDKKLDLGFSFDGDGDRILAVDNNGVIIDGDQIIYIIGCYLKDKGLLKNNSVVLTVMSNPAIIKALKQKGIYVTQVSVGDKYVFDALDSKDLVLGGENSGHVIMRDLLHSGDGLLVGMRLLQIMKETKKTINELLGSLQLYPQKTVNIKGVDKSVLNDEKVKKEIEKVKEKLGTDSLLLVRPSGTESLIRVTVSCENEKLMNETIEKLVFVIKNTNN